MRPVARLWALAALLVTLAACGGHGGGSSTTATTTPAPAPVVTQAANAVSITVDAGPAVLATGPNGFISDNLAFVSVTLCAPGGSNCQTIDHVQVDTGSVGLRIEQSVLNPGLLAALPQPTSQLGGPLGECYQYVDGYAFGSVRDADFQIGGEKVAGMPLQVIGDTGAFSTIPAACSSSGGANLNTVTALGANGIIGLGVTETDCGSICANGGGTGAALYYDCPSSGCGSAVSVAASATAPFQQLPNPVAAMSVDNNGLIITLPAASQSGQASLTGTMYFGIGTQSNNALGSATVIAATDSTARDGSGLVTATYNGQTLPDSFLDSGSNLFLFVDSGIPTCTGADFKGYYCPGASINVNPTLLATNGSAVSASFQLNNAITLLSLNNTSVLPGVVANPTAQGLVNAYPNSFDFGLPFFYGRSIYTAIEGRTAGGVAGPFFAY